MGYLSSFDVIFEIFHNTAIIAWMQSEKQEKMHRCNVICGRIAAYNKGSWEIRDFILEIREEAVL